MNIFSLSRKNILANPLTTLMSVLLFALSIGLITFITLFNHQLKKGLENNLASIDMVIGAKGSPLQLILSSMYHIDAPTGNIPLEESLPFLNPAHPLIATAVPLCLGDSYGAYRIAGTPPSILTLYGAAQLEGRLYHEDFEVLAGATVASKLGLHTGSTFYSTHGLQDNPDLAHDHGAPFIVEGILKPTGTILDQLILCTPATVWKVHEHDSTTETTPHTGGAHDHSETGHEHASTIRLDTGEIAVISDTVLSSLRHAPDKEITSILIRLKNKTSIQSLNFLRNINANTGLMAASPAMELNRLYAMMGNGTEAFSALAILIGIVAAISMFISLYTSLRQRRYEMALMRVAGAGPGKLFQMIIAEGFWIAFLGWMLGMAAGHLGMQWAGDVLERTYRYPFTGWIWVDAEAWIGIGAFVIGILAAVVPAIQGARTNLHQTLAEK